MIDPETQKAIDDFYKKEIKDDRKKATKKNQRGLAD